ncbi:MAG: TolC family protein [Bacteroidales bacterium]
MKILSKLPILLLLITPALLSGQKRWSLEECVRYAWDNNLRIKQQELSIEQNENNLAQARLNFIPTLNASLSHSMNWGRSVNVQDLQIVENKLSQSTSASARAAVSIFEGLTKKNDIKSKEVQLNISHQEVDRLRNDISVEIARSYLQILLSREILKTAELSLKSVEEQLARAKKFADAGSVAYSTVLEVEAQLASERFQVVNASNQLKSALLNLSSLLDLQGETPFDVEDVNIDNLVKEFRGESVDELFRLSLALPQIKSAELNLDNAGLQLAIAKGRALPSVSFSAGYGSYYSDSREQGFFDQFNENRNPSLSFGLSIPIFNNHQIKTSVKNAKLGVKSATYEVRSRQQMLYKEIQQANNDAMAYYERFKASGSNVQAMEESFRYVQQKFDIGSLSATDYIVAKTNLFKAKSEYYQSKYQFVFQLKILDFYKGKPISL